MKENTYLLQQQDYLTKGKQGVLSPFILGENHPMKKDAFLDSIAQKLDFPDWFGRNWDALEEYLTDLYCHRSLILLKALNNYESGKLTLQFS